MDYALVAAGLAGLVLGAELTVRGAVGLARGLGVSPLAVGIVVIGFATSLPELTVCLTAALQSRPDIVVGNIVGSNIANILLILGAVALVTPIARECRACRMEAIAMTLSVVVLTGLGLTGAIDRWAGAAMATGLLVYMTCLMRMETRETKEAAAEAEELDRVPRRAGIIVLTLLAGLLAVIVGADWLVDGAVAIARTFGVSEAVIGLTLIAIGTSLPELVCCLASAIRGHSDMAYGNVLGSNLFNVLGVVGLTAAVAPIPVAEKIAGFDLWIMLGATLLLLPIMLTKLPLGRGIALAFLLAYGAYIAAQFPDIGGVQLALAV